MHWFLSIYSVCEWFLRSTTMASQTLAVGGVAFLLLTRPIVQSDFRHRIFQRACMRMLFWSALASSFSSLVSAGALTAYLSFSSGASLANAVNTDAVILHCVSAAAGFTLALSARKRYFPAPLAVIMAAILIVSHAGVTHAASRVESSPALIIAGIIHLLALATWIGALPYFIMSLLAVRGYKWRPVALRFSRVSIASVIVLIVTGVYMAIPFTRTLDGLFQTNYCLLLSTKILLLSFLLCLGSANYLTIRNSRHKQESLKSVSVFAETETGIGMVAILCAAALALSPLAADTRATRPDSTEISKRFEFAWPRMAIPAYAQLSAAQDRAQVEAARPVAQGPEREKLTSFDVAWSEALHHYAALIVIAMGILALLSQCHRVTTVTRHWPALFLGLAAFLFVVADEDAWPLGKTGFLESLATPRIVQHKLMIAMIAGFAAFEWRRNFRRIASTWIPYVFPLSIATAAALLLTHYGHTDDKNEVLIEISHTPVALLGVIAASARWIELRLPSSSVSRIAAIIWPVAFVAAGLFLLLYRESN